MSGDEQSVSFEEETIEAPEPADLDAFDPNFAHPALAEYIRLDSRRWLVTPERYIFKPLRAFAAMQQFDTLASAPYGKALIGFAFKLRAQRETLVSMARETFAEEAVDEETIQSTVDARLSEYLQPNLEEMLGEARGFKPYEFALGWLQLCDVRRVPLPSRRTKGVDGYDTGGPIVLAKGDSSWDVYYAGRHVHLLHIAAACAWASLGSFSIDLRK